MKKIILSVILLISLFCVSFSLNVKADSGWDSSYDGGGSISSGGSWSSSDYGTGSWDYGTSYSYGSSGGTSIFILLEIYVIVAIIVFSVLIKAKSSKKYEETKPIENKPKSFPRLSDEEIEAIDPTINRDEIVNITFELYKTIQEAWMNFDYKTLEENLTDELYNNYKMLLDTLNLKNQQNIMMDIMFIDGDIIKISKNGSKRTIVVGLKVSVVDYVIDTSSQDILRGSTAPMIIGYNITIVNEDTSSIRYCPNCGAKLDDSNHTECPYCNSIITSKTSKYVMSKKENVYQR